MKRLLQHIRTWSGCFDLMTDMFYIEEDRKSNEPDAGRDNTVLIVIAGLTGWFLTAAILWT